MTCSVTLPTMIDVHSEYGEAGLLPAKVGNCVNHTPLQANGTPGYCRDWPVKRAALGGAQFQLTANHPHEKVTASTAQPLTVA